MNFQSTFVYHFLPFCKIIILALNLRVVIVVIVLISVPLQMHSRTSFNASFCVLCNGRCWGGMLISWRFISATNAFDFFNAQLVLSSYFPTVSILLKNRIHLASGWTTDPTVFITDAWVELSVLSWRIVNEKSRGAFYWRHTILNFPQCYLNICRLAFN